MNRLCVIVLQSMWILAAAVGLAPPAAGTEDPFAPATRNIMRGDYPAAVQLYETFAASNPASSLAPVALLAAGHLQRRALDLPNAALGSYERIIEQYPASSWAAEAAEGKGACLEAGENWPAAGAAYQQALDLAGRCSTSAPGTFDAAWISDVSLRAANCFYQINDHRRVAQTYETLLDHSERLDPAAVAGTRMRLADCYETSGEEHKAAEQYRRILTDHPFREEFGQSLAHRTLIEAYYPLDWSALESYALVRQAFQQGELAEARDRCDQALGGELDERLILAVQIDRAFANTLIEGDYAAGLNTLRTLARRQPTGFDNDALEKRIDFLQTTVALETQVTRSPADAAAWLELGNRYTQARASDKAVEAFRKAAEADPSNDRAHFELGNALAAAGRADEALAAYEEFLKQDPANTAALNLIGYAYLNRGNPEAALPYFQRYAELAPEEENAHDSLGEGYLRLGRLEEAQSEYERATQLNPSFANSYFMLGEIYRQLGSSQKAKAAYQKFIELAPADPRAGPSGDVIKELSKGSSESNGDL